ncbi:UNKNOWN [Stylonychia lemnae]|uniref:Uncharacterized protein n=1 Tax=Stylonychia lemnae TaxID=5949 RepID=A0A078AB38_STYLE|nr:UNKNOWN [Stylonychia lemnae]|eukprot:CDW79091.1 UNKNOWN [Stylonychia lemnae]
MLADPLRENDNYNPDSNIEQTQFLGNKSFRFTSNSLERAQESQYKNSYYETNPSLLFTGKTQEQLMNLRPREHDKELGPASFRYGTKTSIERIYDTLQKRNNSLIEQSEILDKKKIRKLKNKMENNYSSTLGINNELNITQRSKMVKGDIFPEIVKPSDIIPSLHQKTHFKAATSIFLNHQGSLEDKDKSIEKLLNDFSVKRNLQQIITSEGPQLATNKLNLQAQAPRIKFKNTKTPDPIRNRSNLNQSRNQNGILESGTYNIQNRHSDKSELIKMISDESKTISSNIVTQQMLVNCKVMRSKNFNVNPLIAKSKLTSLILQKHAQREINKSTGQKLDTRNNNKIPFDMNNTLF